MDELYALADENEQVHYIPCVLHGDAPRGGEQGDLQQVLKKSKADLKGWRVYVCGDPAIVNGNASLTRHGMLIPSSCQSGVCQTCITKAVKGTPPVESQQGLKDTLAKQNYFLACICKPTEDMELSVADVPFTALVMHV